MSKELDLEKEYLEDLDHYDEGMGIHSSSYKKCKERLIRLAKIENSNPSEALEYVENIQSEIEWAFEFNGRKLEEYEPKHFDIIKQTLLKAQEQEKVLEILKNAYKVCDVFTLLKEDGKFYLIEASGFTCMEISQKEFELLKRWLEKWN